MNLSELQNLSVKELLKIIKERSIRLEKPILFTNKQEMSDAIIKYINNSD